jgi:putative transcriptional regulator
MTLDLAETVGGILLADTADEQMSLDALDHVLARIEQPSSKAVSGDTRLGLDKRATVKTTFPRVLREYVGHDADDVPWKSIGGGAYQHLIETADKSARARLLRIEAGKPVPSHGHRGRELTLVLSGSYQDELSLFGAGDMEDVDEEIVHKPIADTATDCICLVITDAPIRFKEWVPRVFQPMIGI